MSEIQYIRRDPDARVLVVSQRLMEKSISRATIFEFEDLICRFDRADLGGPTAPLGSKWTWKLDRRLIKHTGRPGPLLRKAPPFPDREYELLFVSCEEISDLTRLRPLRGWQGAAAISVCYVEELWDVHIPRRREEIALLRDFDLIFLSCAGSISRLSEATGTPCAYLPPAVDTVAFCPFPDPPQRTIDVYNMGRRSPIAHEAMHRLAADRNWFYVYDTFTGNQALDPHDHRRLLSNLIARTRYFVANHAKVDEPELTERQEELGSRHFEGAAGGAVIIGQPPRCAAFGELLGWPDAVVPMEYDTTDPAATIDALDADPDRVARIRTANIRNCLQCHDWLYRWQMVLDAAQLEPRPGLRERRQILSQLVDALP